MNLMINNNTTVADVQQAFHHQYPFLWVDFFQSNGSSQATPVKVRPDYLISQFDSLIKEHVKVLNVGGDISVAELKKEIEEVLHLRVEVLRKLGNTWVGISYTENWTLDNQNSEAAQIIMD